MIDRPPMLAVLVPLEGPVTIVSNLRNSNEVERLVDWVGRDDPRADLVCDFLSDLRALDRGDGDLRRLP